MASNPERRQDPNLIHNKAARRGLQRSGSDSIIWDPNHEDFPRNWSVQRKLYDALLIFFLEFFTTVISATGASASEKAKKEYGLSRVVALTGFQFMYGIGQALGGLVLPPFSEVLGRRMSYLLSAGIYSISCLLVGVVPSPAGVFIGRFFSGVASAVPSIVLAGSIQDLYTRQKRLWFLWLWNCCTLFGICVGPIYGSYIAANIGWRWIYHIAAIVAAGNFCLLFAVRESRHTRLLAARFDDLQSEVGRLDFHIRNPDETANTRELLKIILIRPARLGLTEPIIILVSGLSASAWGMLYLFTESFTVVYSQFGWSDSVTSLPFIALLPGVLLSGFVRLWDQHQMKEQQERGEAPKPEDKIGGFALAAPALAIGLWMFAWTVPPLVHTHWIVSVCSLSLIGFASTEFAYTLSGYIADAYTIYASSGLASVAFLRGLSSGCMPLFAYQMYVGLGSNVATSIIASVATVFCVTPFVFLKFGRRLRETSRFAKYSADVSDKQNAA